MKTIGVAFFLLLLIIALIPIITDSTIRKIKSLFKKKSK